MSKEFYTIIKGEKVPVTEEQYRAYKRPVWTEKKRKQRQVAEGTTPVSLDRLTEEGYETADDTDVEKIIQDKELLETLYIALDALNDDDRNLINDLFYHNKSERQVAAELGLSQFGVNKRKHKVLEKLYKILKDFY